MGLILLIILSAYTLQPYRDAVTQKDLSGNGQITEPNKAFKNPFIVQVLEGGQPVTGKKIEVLVTFDEQLIRTYLRTDSLGIIKYIPPVFSRTGEGSIVFKTDGQAIKFSFHVVSRNYFYILLFQILGGFAVFFFGLSRAGRGMIRLFGARIRKALFEFTQNRFLGILSGFFGTVMLQSSTATSVMLISFLTAGLISLESALAATLGASIGTTVTVQIIAFKVFDIALILLLVGYLFEQTKGNTRNVGRLVMGFGLIFLGIKLMASGASSISIYPWFKSGLAALHGNPISLFLISFIFTALVHSSAVAIGVVLSLAFSNLITTYDALILVMGANLGTSMTALIASLPNKPIAKRMAIGYSLMKLAGVILFWLLLTPTERLMAAISSDLPRQIANFHTFFNIVITILFFPMLTFVEKLTRLIIPQKREVFGEQRLTPDLLTNPDLALSFTHRRVIQMGDRVYFMLRECLSPLISKNPAQIYRIVAEDDNVDRFEEEITPFLTQLMEEELTQENISRIKALLFIVDELEHIGDIISKSIMRYAERMYKDGLEFSDEGKKEIKNFHKEVLTTMNYALSALTTFELDHAEKASIRKDTVNTLQREFHMMHLDRLAKGTRETVLTSTIHLDLISDLERINFHAASIGQVILEEVYGKKH